MLFEATRPILLNGIGNVVSRGDLDDRSLVVTLQPIPDSERRPKQQIEVEFEAERGRILGALFDALAHGLKNEPEVQPASLPRMADFAKFGVACETAFGPPGTFMAAFENSRHEAVQEIIDGDATADASVSPDTKEDQGGDEADAEDADPAPAPGRRKKGQRGFDYRASERVQDWHDSGRAAKWSCRDEAETEDEDQTTDQ